MQGLVCVQDFEEAAHKLLDRNTLNFYRPGADDEITLGDNRRAFDRWVIFPRVLRDLSTMSLDRTVLGKRVEFPLGISPTAMQRLAHPDGEVANAKAAAAMGTIFILSTVSTCSIEEVAAATPGSRKWFQLYVQKRRHISADHIRRAEAAGFEAVVLTVDLPRTGRRRATLREKFILPRHLRLANFDAETESSPSPLGAAVNDYALVDTNYDSALTWDIIPWIKTVTKLPVIVKGILTPEDARIAIEYGVAGIFVSNHGGRQLDTVHATIDALPAIVEAVEGRCDIYLDGGVTVGKDVFKALALGATMVFAGRPFLWGLAVAGEAGSRKVLEIYKEELRLTAAGAGVTKISELNKDYVGRFSFL